MDGSLRERAAVRCGEATSQYFTHYFRSGGATALFRGGATNQAIQTFGQWRSDIYKQYARIDDQTVLGLALRMVANIWRINMGNHHATTLDWRTPIHSMYPKT